MQQTEAQVLSKEEYLEGELHSDIRHEYYNGQVFAMAGAGEKHNIISGNLFSAMRSKARGTDCRTFIADMKLLISELDRFYYPDILLACDPTDDHEYYKEKPCLVIEVLSPSTEVIDRREKLHSYQGIPSLKEYILISQEMMQVECYRRHGDSWEYSMMSGEDAILQLECLDLTVDMAMLYEDVFV